jgi:hypothetical protein
MLASCSAPAKPAPAPSAGATRAAPNVAPDTGNQRTTKRFEQHMTLDAVQTDRRAHAPFPASGATCPYRRFWYGCRQDPNLVAVARWRGGAQ